MTKHGEPMEWLEARMWGAGDECLLWPYTCTQEGYARVWHNKRMYPTYRLVCEMAHGQPSDDSLQAAHSCGRGHLGCVNPRHLRWATRAENEADKIAHGTVSRGAKNAAAKITAFDVEVIRELAPLATQAVLARHYGVSSAQISRIVSGQRWAI